MTFTKYFFVSLILKERNSLILLVLWMNLLLFLAFGVLPVCYIHNALFLFSLTASKTLVLRYFENPVAVISYVKEGCAIKNNSVTIPVISIKVLQ